ncbi:flagellar hook-associated protein FlgL [Schauerella aestuarii]|uniref:flagellar hook-associated protein FlgL n=1 Tax=Schauerella aestuarii TaxID=2511204 RepID=UPI00136EC143|nr:flagellar hook-associated protein FlgL [Achromobacter aestuarii]MYZ44888.1 flagellar hook-associated protein 3 [Achromobacter aestuarii]
MMISTQMSYRNSQNAISSARAKADEQMLKNADMKKFLNPGDDPLGAAQSINTAQEFSVNKAYQDNRTAAKQQLQEQETVMTTVIDSITALRTKIVQAGNATYSDDDRAVLATELQGIRDSLLANANAKDANGQYLFSGLAGNAQPYDEEGAFKILPPLNEARTVQVESSREVATSIVGDKFFSAEAKDGSGKVDLFETLKNLIDTLNTPVADDPAAMDNLNAVVGESNRNMQSVFDNATSTRAALGARFNEIESLDGAGAQQSLRIAKKLSDIEDLDPVQGISQLQSYQLAVQVSAMSYQILQSIASEFLKS